MRLAWRVVPCVAFPLWADVESPDYPAWLRECMEAEGLGPTAALGRELKQAPPSERALAFIDGLARREADASASQVWLRLRSALEAGPRQG